MHNAGPINIFMIFPRDNLLLVQGPEISLRSPGELILGAGGGINGTPVVLLVKYPPDKTVWVFECGKN